MAIGIDDLDDDDVLEVEDGQQEQYVNIQPSVQGEDDVLSDFLKTKGIDDISKIKFEDDNGQIEERNWNDLTKEEKFNILNTQYNENPIDNSVDLSDEEIELLNTIRTSNMTPSQYISQIQGTPQEVQPVYKVDDLSDDELYLLDLESRVGELNDDEAAQALSFAKQNEDFYKKQVDGIRKEYKEREDFAQQQEQATLEAQQEEAFMNYQNQIINVIDNFNSVGNLDLNLENSDKETLAEFMLSQDESGKNYLYEALQDPETLTKAAWFILNGEDAFNSITDYFTNQIKLVSEHQYNKGLQDGRNGVQSKPSVVITQKSSPERKVYKSIDDLDD